VISIGITEVQGLLNGLVNDALSFSKSSRHIKRKAKERSAYLLKDPAKYDYRKSVSTIHKDEVTCVELLQNGNLITGSLDSAIKIWDPVSEQIFKKYEGHVNSVTHIIELMNGNIASCSTDKTINIWDLHSAEILFTLEGFETEIKQLVELDAENLVILSDEEKAFAVWSYRREQDDNCQYYDDHEDRINHVIVVQNKLIFSASTDRTIKRWILKHKKEKPPITYEGHEDAVLKLAYLDDKMLASASGDATVRIWDI
jgi:WD40 repeat protein